MRLAAERGALVDALVRCSRAATTRQSVRVLAGVRIEAADGALALAATDLELGLLTSVPADVADAGAAVVPAKPLLAIVQTLDGGHTELTLDGSALVVRSGDSDYRLRTLPVDDFPELPVVGEGARFTLAADTLADAARRVLRAASSDLSRPVYTGVRLNVDGRKLTLTATDGYRLATARTDLPEPLQAFDVLVPARVLAEVVRIRSGEGEIAVALGERLIAFTVSRTTLVARTLDGRPQDHERILASSFAHSALVPRTPLLRAVDRASLLAERGSAVELDFRDDEIRVRARSAELGEANERVALASRGPTMRIGFNSRYLRDGIDLVNGDDVRFEMNDGLGAVVLHGASDDFAYLVAPLRLRD